MSSKKKQQKKEPHSKKELYEAKLIFVCAALVGFICFAWYAYNTQVNNVKETDLPIIHAPKQVKFKPADPGGMMVPNRDKHIYDHVLGKKTLINKTKVSGENETVVERADLSALVAKQLKTKTKKH